MTARPVRELDTLPSLGSLYATGLRRQVAAKLPGARPASLVLPDTEHRVSGVKADTRALVAYQRLMGDSVRDELPSAFVHGMVFPAAMSVLVRDDFPLPLLGMVHLRNEVEHFAPVAVDQVLDAVAYAQNLGSHHSGTTLEVVAEVRADGEMLWRGVSTYLARGIWPGEKPARHGAGRPPFVPPVRTASWSLGADTGRRFASVLGDYNPIHLSAASAKLLGMKRQIAHGMYLAGRALATAAPHDGGYGWEVEFMTPAFLPGVVDVSIRQEEGSVSFDGWASRSGKPHFTGAVSAL
ncbi:MaoC family dehydratase [Paeniglutamicibacter cryotolerans]|uniref:Acyl dehydratase n=1 Tax=Paeniglutamicibacter cryotolerans TaxID=670079 RepID=A0A839QNV6_9MICC|nr:MaoC/PaaZ C-terminal domain-containing protein [Paeniglutamicibacter cryotolerans]MBB2997283.1 acyl dehydratase [Paeniglutamicibacter cryotolerans]